MKVTGKFVMPFLEPAEVCTSGSDFSFPCLDGIVTHEALGLVPFREGVIPINMVIQVVR